MGSCKMCGRETAGDICASCGEIEAQKIGQTDEHEQVQEQSAEDQEFLIEGVPIECTGNGSKFFEPMRDIASVVPEKYLTSGVLKEISLGRNKGDYQELLGFFSKDGKLSLYELSCKPYDLMTFDFVSLHEMGHVIEKQLDDEDMDVLEENYKVILSNDVFRKTSLGRTEVIRVGNVQRASMSDFFADFHGMYVLEGDELREFIGQQEGDTRQAYENAYEMFKKLYDGRELTKSDVQRFYDKDVEERQKQVQVLADLIERDYGSNGEEVPDYFRKDFVDLSGMEPSEWTKQKSEGKDPQAIPWWIAERIEEKKKQWRVGAQSERWKKRKAK